MSVSLEIPLPDLWAMQASELPLAFSQVREDPRLDMELATKIAPGGTVVMIASGGDTAACLGRLPLQLHLVDMNPAQLALSQVKWSLAARPEADKAAELLGHLPMAPHERRRELGELLCGIGLDETVFGPPDWIAELGVDHAGRYEVNFAELRKRLAPWNAPLKELLHSRVPVPGVDETPLGEAISAAFGEVMSRQNLVCLFGHEASRCQTRKPSGSASDFSKPHGLRLTRQWHPWTKSGSMCITVDNLLAATDAVTWDARRPLWWIETLKPRS